MNWFLTVARVTFIHLNIASKWSFCMVLNEQTIYIYIKKNAIDCLVWESSWMPTVPRMLWGPTTWHNQVKIDQCLCQSACKYLHSVLLNMASEERRPLKILIAVIFVHYLQPKLLSPCYLRPGTKYRRNKTTKDSSVNSMFQVYNWQVKLASYIVKLNKLMVSSASRQTVFECVSVMIAYCFFVCFFCVFWSKQMGHLTMTALCKTLAQQRFVSWLNE